MNSGTKIKAFAAATALALAAPAAVATAAPDPALQGPVQCDRACL
jgi:hypothetical protein